MEGVVREKALDSTSVLESWSGLLSRTVSPAGPTSLSSLLVPAPCQCTRTLASDMSHFLPWPPGIAVIERVSGMHSGFLKGTVTFTGNEILIC